MSGISRKGAEYKPALAAVCNHGEAVEVLLNNGADAEAKDDDGLTTLHMTSSQGLSRLVEALLGKALTLRPRIDGDRQLYTRQP